MTCQWLEVLLNSLWSCSYTLPQLYDKNTNTIRGKEEVWGHLKRWVHHLKDMLQPMLQNNCKETSFLFE